MITNNLTHIMKVYIMKLDKLQNKDKVKTENKREKKN